MPDWIASFFEESAPVPAADPPSWLVEISERQAAPAPPSTGLLFGGALLATVLVGMIARRRP